MGWPSSTRPSVPARVRAELDISDSGREGCAVSTLTITSEPKDWRGAVEVAIQEVRRLQRFGVTRGELERYKQALQRDSEQLAEQSESVPSVDNLEFVMESLALGHTVLDQKTVGAGGARVEWPAGGQWAQPRGPQRAGLQLPGHGVMSGGWAGALRGAAERPQRQPPHRALCHARARTVHPTPLPCSPLTSPLHQAHEYLLMVIDTISKPEVDALAKSLLSYLSHYNQEQQVCAGGGEVCWDQGARRGVRPALCLC